VRIFCEMRSKDYEPPYAFDRRPNFWKIAETLGLDGRTVKARARQWEVDGIIKYYQVIPNYNLLGIKASCYVFRFDDETKKYEAMKKFRLVDGILEMVDNVPGTVFVWIAYEDEDQLSRRLELVTELSDLRSRPLKFFERVFDPVPIDLTRLDWQIIMCLRYNALKSASKIAEECGVTRKTVRARLERLIQHRTFFSKPFFDASKITGFLVYTLVFIFDPSRRQEALGELDNIFQEKCFKRILPPHGNALFFIWGKSLAELEENSLKTRQVKGVLDVKWMLTKEIIEFPQLIDKLINKKIAMPAEQLIKS